MTTVITGSDIPVAQMMVVRAAIKLEAKGMRHSGGSVRARWAARLGLKPRDSHDKYIAELTRRIDAALGERNV